MRRICVFSGSSPGRHPAYRAAAADLGAMLVRERIGLVYGGASVGLMGAVADAVLAGGGEVIGVIPKALLDLEVAHDRLNELRVVDSMHERKAAMAELADGFVALPGGIGTLEETFEIWTWAQLGLHAKPCGLLNVEGFHNRLVRFLDSLVEERFLRAEHREMLIVRRDAASLLRAFVDYAPPLVTKWISRDSV